MADNSSIAIFVILSVCFALVLIMKKDTLAPGFKRGLAIMAVVMVSFSFFLILYSLFTMGQ
ncbi:MAG: hypothetical protein K0R57_1789 [Paenibacillaceae bacterium]|nr:hypothetical protein [Paenibacillaceae bacterium]